MVANPLAPHDPKHTKGLLGHRRGERALLCLLVKSERDLIPIKDT
jgi:hypothetical protein